MNVRRAGGPSALTDAISFQRAPLAALRDRQRVHGDLFQLTSAFGGRMLVIGAPPVAREVLSGPPERYLAGAANQRILPVLPDGTLLTLDGSEHRVRRRLLTPLLHGAALRGVTPAIRELAEREISTWPLGRPFAVLPRMRSLALGVAARLLLGIEDGPTVLRLETLLRSALPPYSLLAGIERLDRLGRASPQALARRRRDEFGRQLTVLLRGHAGAGVIERLGSDEVLALLLAGHETTATALAWAIDHLARTPEVADALVREREGPGRTWLDAVIWETLRLRPPLVDIVRRTTEPVTLDGRRVSAGTILLIPPPLIHLHGASPDPDRFDPRRFAARRPDPATWLPFGGGARRCIGASLAMLELREILPTIVARFRLRAHGSRPERPTLRGTALVPAGGARVILAERGRW